MYKTYFKGIWGVAIFVTLVYFFSGSLCWAQFTPPLRSYSSYPTPDSIVVFSSNENEIVVDRTPSGLLRLVSLKVVVPGEKTRVLDFADVRGKYNDPEEKNSINLMLSPNEGGEAETSARLTIFSDASGLQKILFFQKNHRIYLKRDDARTDRLRKYRRLDLPSLPLGPFFVDHDKIKTRTFGIGWVREAVKRGLLMLPRLDKTENISFEQEFGYRLPASRVFVFNLNVKTLKDGEQTYRMATFGNARNLAELMGLVYSYSPNDFWVFYWLQAKTSDYKNSVVEFYSPKTKEFYNARLGPDRIGITEMVRDDQTPRYLRKRLSREEKPFLAELLRVSPEVHYLMPCNFAAEATKVLSVQPHAPAAQ